MYNLITFETPSNSLSSSLSPRGAKNEAINTFVIARLNALALRLGNLLFRGGITIHSIKEEIGFRQHGSQTFDLRTEIATGSLRSPCNDKTLLF